MKLLNSIEYLSLKRIENILLIKLFKNIEDFYEKRENK